jgi:hypothetical protein
MKKINYILLGMLLVGLSSCFKKDNYDGPDARIYGNIIDSYTGKPLLSSQNDWQIRLVERSWTGGVPTGSDQPNIPIKQDGSYNNNKYFAGTYDMVLFNGPFWPVDTVKNVPVTREGTQKDFTVTPYIQVIDFTPTLVGTSLTMTFRLKAPKRNGMPDLYDVKPYLSLTEFVGESNYINISEYNNQRILNVRKPWLTYFGDVETSPVITLGPFALKSGYTYNVRVGANVNTGGRTYNYSEIKQVKVP